MTISDAELSAMYGRGLHPDTAARVIDEVRALRLRLAETEELAARWEAQAGAADGTATHWYGRWVEVSAERDAMTDQARLYMDKWLAAEAETYEHKRARAELNERCTQYRMRAEAAEARLAEAEAERDGWAKAAGGLKDAEANTRARLDEVEALCDKGDQIGLEAVSVKLVRAAARGKDWRCTCLPASTIPGDGYEHRLTCAAVSGEGDRPGEVNTLLHHPFERAPIGLECRRCGAGIDSIVHSGEDDRGTWPHCTHCGTPPRLCGADPDGFHRVPCVACENAPDQRTCGCKGKPFQVCDTCQNWPADHIAIFDGPPLATSAGADTVRPADGAGQ